jgi:hypothetical protein
MRADFIADSDFFFSLLVAIMGSLLRLSNHPTAKQWLAGASVIPAAVVFVCMYYAHPQPVWASQGEDAAFPFKFYQARGHSKVLRNPFLGMLN